MVVGGGAVAAVANAYTVSLFMAPEFAHTPKQSMMSVVSGIRSPGLSVNLHSNLHMRKPKLTLLKSLGVWPTFQCFSSGSPNSHVMKVGLRPEFKS